MKIQVEESVEYGNMVACYPGKQTPTGRQKVVEFKLVTNPILMQKNILRHK